MITIFAVVPHALVAGEQPNLLAAMNPSFEAGTAGWTLTHPSAISQEWASDGRGSLHLAATVAKEDVSAFSSFVPITQKKMYSARVNASCQSPLTGLRVQLEFWSGTRLLRGVSSLPMPRTPAEGVASISAAAPAGALRARLRVFDAGSGVLDAYVDGALLVEGGVPATYQATLPPVNLLSAMNPSFEATTGDWTVAGGTGTPVTDWASDENTSLHVVGAGARSEVSAQSAFVPAATGRFYSARITGKYVAVIGGLRTRLEFWNDQRLLQGISGKPGGKAGSSSTLAVTAMAPAGTTRARLRVWDTGTGKVDAFLDAAMIVEGGVPTDYYAAPRTSALYGGADQTVNTPEEIMTVLTELTLASDSEAMLLWKGLAPPDQETMQQQLSKMATPKDLVSSTAVRSSSDTHWDGLLSIHLKWSDGEARSIAYRIHQAANLYEALAAIGYKIPKAGKALVVLALEGLAYDSIASRIEHVCDQAHGKGVLFDFGFRRRSKDYLPDPFVTLPGTHIPMPFVTIRPSPTLIPGGSASINVPDQPDDGEPDSAPTPTPKPLPPTTPSAPPALFLGSDYLRYLPSLRFTNVDFNGDGVSDLVYWKPAAGLFYISNAAGQVGRYFGLPGDIPVPGDYDGDGKTDLSTWRPSNGAWSVEFSAGAGVVAYTWGAPGDLPVPGDYNGDGVTDLAVFRPSTGVWYISNTAGQRAYNFGQPGDIPVPGDYDGDGIADLAIFHPADATWNVSFSSTGQRSGLFRYGLPGDVPVAADYNGDGITDIAVYRPSTAGWSISNTLGQRDYVFGLAGDVPVPGDYDGDGVTDIAVWRPSNGTWTVSMSSTHQISGPHSWGFPGDMPLSARGALAKKPKK